MTPYSAAADGSFSSRESSRSAALRGLLGQLQLLEPLAELVDLGLLVVALAELLLDRLQLLAEEVLALALLHLRLDLGLDLRAELDHLELAAEDARDRVQPLLDVGGVEQRLLLVGLQAHRRGDKVRERTRVVDVRGRDLELLGEVGHGGDDPPEQVLDVARERLELLRLLDLVRHLLELADQVRVVGDPALELDPVSPWTRIRSVPSGTRISLWTIAAVPTS